MSKFWGSLPVGVRRWLVVVLGGFVFLALDFVGTFSELESITVDSRFRLRESVYPGPLPSEQLLVLGVTQQGIQDPYFGRWPWKRAIHGDMLALLGAAKPKAVSFDIIFSEPSASADDDAYFAESAAQVPTVVGATMLRVNPIEFDDPAKSQNYDFEYHLQSPRRLEVKLMGPDALDSPGSVTIDGVDPTGEAVSETFLFKSGVAELTGKNAMISLSSVKWEFEKKGVPINIIPGSSPAFQPLSDVEGPIEDIPAPAPPLPPYLALANAAKLGFAEASPDPDGVWRKVPLVIRYRDEVFPTLVTRTMMTYWNLSDSDIEVVVGKHLTFKREDGSVRVPINERGEMLLNYRSIDRFREKNVLPYSQYFKQLAGHYMESKPWPENLPHPEDKIVFVGVLAEVIDIGATPLSPLTPKAYIHAHAIDNILRQDFIKSPHCILVVLVWILFTGLTLQLLSCARIFCAILIPAGILLGYATLAYLLFITNSVQLPMAWAMIGFALFHGGSTVRRWYHAHESHLRIEGQLRAAGEIQMGMLPKLIEVIRGHENKFDIAATLIPATENSGDFYDVFWLAENRICLVVGDVCDKGIVSSIFMVMSKTVIHGLARPEYGVEEIVARANSALADQNEKGLFATVIMAVIDLTTGEMAYTTAGHHGPALLLTTGEVTVLEATEDFAVGPISGIDYQVRRHTLKPGETLFLCTDGVDEAFNPEGEQFGIDRELETLKGQHGKTCQQLLDQMLIDIQTFAGKCPQSDDITMMAFALHPDFVPD
ncbi:MAG: CHASE2 domain-containing sensor protein [Verrucomicrobiales bacterium]|jgi:CHASE2 domain-containing sensor protein